jgi:excinuclease ABC subunit C
MPSTLNPKSLPTEPGCYLFKNNQNQVIYVGKAKNLKKRVLNYFQKKDFDPKTLLLKKHIQTIDYYITKTENEALLLENNLIKKHYPKYNIDLKDSRRYAYLRLTQSEFPFLEVARARDEKGIYFGPFTSARYRKEILNILYRQFKILTRKPSPLKRKSLNKETYKIQINQAKQILSGKVNFLIKELKNKMHLASKSTNYEYALSVRRQIEALEILKEKQSVELRRSYDADIINYTINGNQIYLLLFNIYKGILENKQEFEFPNKPNILQDFLIEYYSQNKLPKEIILPKNISKDLEQFLSSLTKKSLIITVPKKGTKKALLDLAFKNVKRTIEGEQAKVFDLQKALSLKTLPNIIECFDISHIRGKHTVGSMVTFLNGKPNKAHYRKFKVKIEANSDDYAAMREVIHRRYAKSLRLTLPLPDLIVIDGGKGQLSSAVSILKELNLNIPIISLAKRLEEIFLPGKSDSIQLNQKQPAILLLRAIRDEAHRFAISYNRLLRNKAVRK